MGAKRGHGKSSDDVAVGFLVCLLLLLLILLFLAWRRLSRNSGGRYHPRRLLRGLMLRWQGLRGEALPEEQSQGHQDEKLGDSESGEEQPVDVGDEGEQQLLLQGEEEEEEEKQEAPKEQANPEPAQEKVVQEASEEEEAPKATESSAGALLSDLHSFSGTAAWEDPGKHLHVTAL